MKKPSVGQRLLRSVAEAQAYSRGEPNCVVELLFEQRRGRKVITTIQNGKVKATRILPIKQQDPNSVS